MTFRTFIFVAAGCTGILTALAALGYAHSSAGWLLSCAITFGTTFYHLAMRLLVGHLIPNTFDYHSHWFQPKPFEAKLYRTLRVKKWKDRMPTYDPRLFSMTENTPEQILRNMCQSEIVHEVIVLLSFIPLLFSLLWDSFFVFLITSIFAAVTDTSFVILQRYNRPRVERLMNRQNSRRCTP
ncbi:MAG: hypothetical protein IJO45_06075 [Oscillospiraceae bacterium]|nr:hypothetical protein [Oscillospiraceae bacterium]